MTPFDAYALPGMPWKNGGGVTRTLFVSPPGADFDDFDWRVSIADIETSGGFSRFPSVDRTIMLLSGAGMVLCINDGETVTLNAPFEPFAFSGDDRVDSELLDGPTRDLNVMTRRGRATAMVNVRRSEFTVRGAAAFFCARGGYRVEDAELEAGWALATDGEPSEIRCIPETQDAVMISVRINAAQE